MTDTARGSTGRKPDTTEEIDPPLDIFGGGPDLLGDDGGVTADDLDPDPNVFDLTMARIIGEPDARDDPRGSAIGGAVETAPRDIPDHGGADADTDQSLPDFLNPDAFGDDIAADASFAEPRVPERPVQDAVPVASPELLASDSVLDRPVPIAGLLGADETPAMISDARPTDDDIFTAIPVTVSKADATLEKTGLDEAAIFADSLRPRIVDGQEEVDISMPLDVDEDDLAALRAAANRAAGGGPQRDLKDIGLLDALLSIDGEKPIDLTPAMRVGSEDESFLLDRPFALAPLPNVTRRRSGRLWGNRHWLEWPTTPVLLFCLLAASIYFLHGADPASFVYRSY